MKHLTRIPKDENKEAKAYVLYINVRLGKAQEVSNALVAELGEESSNEKSAFVCDCIVHKVQEPVAQRRNAHAREILNAPGPLPYTLDDLIGRLADANKALDGWPMTIIKEFVPVDSPEHRAWIKEQDNE